MKRPKRPRRDNKQKPVKFPLPIPVPRVKQPLNWIRKKGSDFEEARQRTLKGGLITYKRTKKSTVDYQGRLDESHLSFERREGKKVTSGTINRQVYTPRKAQVEAMLAQNKMAQTSLITGQTQRHKTQLIPPAPKRERRLGFYAPSEKSKTVGKRDEANKLTILDVEHESFVHRHHTGRIEPEYVVKVKEEKATPDKPGLQTVRSEIHFVRFTPKGKYSKKRSKIIKEDLDVPQPKKARDYTRKKKKAKPKTKWWEKK